MNYILKKILFLSLIACFLVTSSCKTNKGQKGQTEAFEQMQRQILNQALGQGMRDAALNGKLTDLQQMVRQGANINSPDEQGRTALMFAAYNGHSDIVQFLIEEKAQVNVVDSAGRTALMYASSGPFQVTVDILLKSGANVNLVDDVEHWTALMFAASEGNTEVVRQLLEKGADIHLKDVDGENAYDFAVSNNHPETAKLLK